MALILLLLLALLAAQPRKVFNALGWVALLAAIPLVFAGLFLPAGWLLLFSSAVLAETG